MSKQIQLRQKIKSIQTTKKITNAIRQVSMSLYSKLDHTTSIIKNYTQNVNNLFSKLILYDTTWQKDLLSDSKPDIKPLFIIVSTSKGLCGGLNSNLFKHIEKNFNLKNFQTPNFVSIGNKAHNLIKDKELGEIILSYSDFNSNNYLAIANDFISKIQDKSLAFTSITVFYNEPKSFFVQKPTKLQIVPLKINSEKKSIESLSEIIRNDLIWEQNSHDILDALSIRYIKAQIIQTLFQALISEYSARFVAMDSSTTNADKYIEKITLQYNKMRQAEITKEVSGLCAGFMNKNS